MSFTRVATVNQLRSEKVAEYRRLHAAAWPEVLDRISSCNIRNYSIFLREPENLIFGYYEYYGDDFAADMQKMADDPRTREWWAFTDPCQQPLDSAGPGENWVNMVEVFHHD